MKESWIAVVNLLVLAAIICSLIFNIRLILRRKTELSELGKVPPCPLTLSDVLLLGCIIALTLAFKLPQFLPVAAVGGAIILYYLRGTQALTYWQFDAGKIGFYCKTGLLGYITVLLPLIVIALVVLLICVIFHYKFTQPQVEIFLQLKTIKQITIFIFYAVIVAPIWEEVVFRGVLYPFFKKKMPIVWAMIGSSVIWAAIHLHIPVILPFTFFGCALCFVYERTGKLGCNIAMHAVFNLTSTLLLLFMKYYGNWQAY